MIEFWVRMVTQERCDADGDGPPSGGKYIVGEVDNRGGKVELVG